MDGVLSLEGERNPAEPQSHGPSLRREESRAVRAVHSNAPPAVKPGKAEFELGILTVRLPKADAAKPTQIEIALSKPTEGKTLSD